MPHCAVGLVANWAERAPDFRAHIPAESIDVDSGGHAALAVEQQHCLVALTDDFGKNPAGAIIH
jgi:hypothetical protein